MRDLTRTATGNAAARRSAADAAVAADSTGRLAAFRELVAGSVMSTNVFAYKIEAYHDTGEILDTRRLYVHLAGGDEVEGERRFAADQDTWLVRRQGFEDLWEHGRRLVYGAVNAGGMGTEDYGPFCLVVADPVTPPPDALAVFPANTVTRYAPEGQPVREAAACAETTAWPDRAELAVTECATEVAARPEPDWPEILCCPGRFLEIARSGALPTATIGEVRLRRADVETFDDLQLRAVRGDTLDGDDAHLAAAYDRVQRWRRDHGAVITEID